MKPIKVSNHKPMIQTTMAHLQPWLIFFCVLLPFANSTSFNFSSFKDSTKDIINLKADAFLNVDNISLTKNEAGTNPSRLGNSTGWATYAHPVQLYDKATGTFADFTTHFSFVIDAADIYNNYGDGLAFFLAPWGSDIPDNSVGGHLGLFNDTPLTYDSSPSPSPAPSIIITSTVYQTVAIEFDTYHNIWDPADGYDHSGINIGSIRSNVTVSWNSSGLKNNSTANAWVSYNATTTNLSLYLTYASNPVFNGADSNLSLKVDLSKVLPERVVIGFSAATGASHETHTLHSWEFNSSGIREKSHVWVIVGSTIGAVAFVGVLGVIWFFVWKKNNAQKTGDDIELSMDDEFAKGTGPKRFTYRELRSATNGFDEAGKLGEGGFGAVYKGVLRDSSGTEVAIKRVSKGSNQGRKEYAAEVKIISRLRHRNLVQLIGWCHDRGELLLVYELMPNGSLNSHLFGSKNPPIRWGTRYKIARGVASSLLYLHEEWEQCVVHRDIKSSNIMLDSGFNAKLGDFGLARLLDHGRTSQTTVLAGTMGYLAPECVTTGKASKESDVYSFGVVALEIACGRRPVEPMLPEEKVRLVEYVWGLYGRREIFEAVDERLEKDFDEAEMERLMVVGLWCAHPDYSLRPTIRQVINVLSFEAALPVLPSKMPVPTYYAPPIDFNGMSYTTSSSRGMNSGTSNSSMQTVSSGSSPSIALLQSRTIDM
ncbi:L-type lectin-domain containing receptor kinase IX.2 [Acorus gramineus]|uniref:L-type lectin-domain containing receptor kinase IX.2 n=1 Tax=Acorus gramineus TaxID=55184 RepID=A0AAV9AZ53_ACOGR|nr:L-type lectin-domain containing receptor kinase IX.2 [Acorus gramineus]